MPHFEYDYVIVGAGLFGSVFAYEASLRGKKVLVLDKRSHIAGNVFTEKKENIDIHLYGPHIFHTNSDRIWKYITQFGEFNSFVNRPKVSYKDQFFSFPINLMTLYQLWGVKTPNEAETKLESVRIKKENIDNLEDWCLSQVGEEIYNVFIKGYTQKQWKRDPKLLPTFIIKRLPIRMSFDDNYYNDKYQGVPIDGYTAIIEKMLSNVTVKLDIDFLQDKAHWESVGEKILYTGKIDEFFNYKYGELEYRTLEFETKQFEGDYQGNAVINYTDAELPFTRVIEHKHFNYKNQKNTIVTWEYPADWAKDKIPYYPINDINNMRVFKRYDDEKREQEKYIFGGRLAEYRYYDMDQVIASSLKLVDHEFKLGV